MTRDGNSKTGGCSVIMVVVVMSTAAARLHLHCQVKFVGTIQSNPLVAMQLPVIGDHDRFVITVQQVDWHRFQFHEDVMVIVVLVVLMIFIRKLPSGFLLLVMLVFRKDEDIRAINDNGICWQGDLVFPLLHWQSQVQTLTGSEFPLLKLTAFFCQRLCHFVRKFEKEPYRLRRFIDMIVNAQQLQLQRLCLGMAVRINDRFGVNRPLLLRNSFQHRKVDLERRSFDIQLLVVGNRAQRFATANRLAGVNQQVFDRIAGRGVNCLP